MEILKLWIESLNDYSELLALMAVIVPIVIYWKERKEARRAMQDELDAMNEMSRFPMSNSDRERYERKRKLEKGLMK